jgi:hypothetical protein
MGDNSVWELLLFLFISVEECGDCCLLSSCWLNPCLCPELILFGDLLGDLRPCGFPLGDDNLLLGGSPLDGGDLLPETHPLGDGNLLPNGRLLGDDDFLYLGECDLLFLDLDLDLLTGLLCGEWVLDLLGDLLLSDRDLDRDIDLLRGDPDRDHLCGERDLDL